jgi:MscS family membrane protein
MDIRYELKFKSDMTEIVIRELLKAGIISKDDLF